MGPNVIDNSESLRIIPKEGRLLRDYMPLYLILRLTSSGLWVYTGFCHIGECAAAYCENGGQLFHAAQFDFGAVQ